MKSVLTILFPLLVSQSLAAPPIHIIPEPVQVVEKPGFFHFNKNTRIILIGDSNGISAIIHPFASEFKRASGIFLTISQNKPTADPPNSIYIELNNSLTIQSTEGYYLSIDKNDIHISARGLPGIFYAFETIRQLLPAAFYDESKTSASSEWQISCVSILDYPRYSFRGMNLDVSRHFFPISFIKKYLDILAVYKINIFHWHLTDSHGWRVEIKQYPKLTTVGAWRAERKHIPMTIAEPTGKNEPADYGGFYTQEEIKDLVRYAAQRFITIIPEIEMPGHCTAALVAYPEYNCLNNKNPLLMPCGYPGDLLHNFCVGYDSTYVFLENILKEIMELFPSPYIHIGGDEVRGAPWLSCPRCLKRMKENGFKNTKQLQAYFTKRIDSFISVNNRRTIGWEEILLSDVSPGAVAMAWHGIEGAQADLQTGHSVVMSPYHYTYFDFYQSDPGLEEYITYAGLYLDTVYAFNPSSGIFADTENKRILGGEGSLWTENVETPARVEYMLLPRLLALSECLWSQNENKNYRKFIDKTENEFKRLDRQNIHYAKSMYNLSINSQFDSAVKKIYVTINNQVANKYNIRYTLDGKRPEVRSKLYNGRVLIDKSCTLQTGLFKNGLLAGKINKQEFAIHLGIGSKIRVIPGSPDEDNSRDYNRLADGIFGTIEPYDGRWVSYHDSVQTVILDLGRSKTIHSISVRFMEDPVSDINLPKKIEFAVSQNGTDFKIIYKKINKTIPRQLLRNIVRYKKDGLAGKTRFFRLKIENANLNSGDQGKNNYLMDEIVLQ